MARPGTTGRRVLWLPHGGGRRRGSSPCPFQGVHAHVLTSMLLTRRLQMLFQGYLGTCVRYVSSEEFANEFINSIRDGKGDNFRKRYREITSC